MKALPGFVRQRVKRSVTALGGEPRPSQSKELSFPELEGELRRLRIDNWRIVYAVSESARTVDVLAVRKRPPYQYEDLPELIADLLDGR